MEPFHQGWKFIRKIHGSLIPPFVEANVGMSAYEFSYNTAEAVYHPKLAGPLNQWFEQKLNNQTSGTSFGMPLAMMAMADIFLICGQEWLDDNGHAKEAKLLKTARLLAPFAIAGIFITREFLQAHFNPGFLDNHLLDNIASLAAAFIAEGVVLSNLNTHRKPLIEISPS